jgi:hypothetical protein
VSFVLCFVHGLPVGGTCFAQTDMSLNHPVTYSPSSSYSIVASPG